MNSSLGLNDGRTVIYQGLPSGDIHVWDVVANEDIAAFEFGPGRVALASARNGSVLAAAGTQVIQNKGKLKVWRLNNLPERLRIPGQQRGPGVAAFAADGTWIATNSRNDLVRL